MFLPEWDDEKFHLLDQLGESVKPVMDALDLEVKLRFWRSDWCASMGDGWVEWVVLSGEVAPAQFYHALKAALAAGPWRLKSFVAVVTSINDVLREIVRANGWEDLAAGVYDWGDCYGEGELLGAYIPDNEFVSCDRLNRELGIDVCIHARISFEPKPFELVQCWMCNDEWCHF